VVQFQRPEEVGCGRPKIPSQALYITRADESASFSAPIADLTCCFQSVDRRALRYVAYLLPPRR
jgi:hypothetical protein